MNKVRLMNRSVLGRVLVLNLLALGFSAGLLAAAPGPAARTKVVTVRSARAVDARNRCDLAEVKAMLDQGLRALTGAPSSRAAWAALGVTPSDVVGIKVNCNNWTIKLSPHPELVAALTESLSEVVPANNVVFYDMTRSDIEEAGFTRNASTQGARFLAADTDAGFDGSERLTTIVTSTCTKLINLASMKTVDANYSGLVLPASLFFKNHVGSLSAADAPKSHGDFDFVAALLARPSIRRKAILNLCDGLRATYKRGVPWYWGGLLFGLDPVASETVALQVINAQRQTVNEKPFDLPGYLRIAATKYGLGTTAAEKIDWVKIER